MTFERVPEFDLPDTHPHPQKHAFECSVCGALSYPPNPEAGCPICSGDEDDS